MVSSKFTHVAARVRIPVLCKAGYYSTVTMSFYYPALEVTHAVTSTASYWSALFTAEEDDTGSGYQEARIIRIDL